MRDTIVVTGASSHLGHRAAGRLAATGRYRIIALHSPRASGEVNGRGGVEGFKVDLAAPLPPEVQDALSGAARVLHFAWDRRGDAEGSNMRNMAMIETLLGACPPAAMVFVSSVAGAPDAASAYGRHKHQAAERVRAAGGSVFVPGLVVDDPPAGPHAILTRVVGRLPVALRLTRGAPLVYPVSMPRLLEMIERLAEPSLPPGTWRGFEAPVAFNAFLAGIEAHHPRRRMPVQLPARVLMAAARAGRGLPFPTRAYCDKILTFLQKNDAHLAMAQTLPGSAVDTQFREVAR